MKYLYIKSLSLSPLSLLSPSLFISPSLLSLPLLQQGDSPLYWAARHGHLDVVQFLCECGASLDSQDKVRRLYQPISFCNHTMYMAFICSLFPCFLPFFLPCPPQSGETALHVSARYGHPEVLAFLCRSGANLNLQDKVDTYMYVCMYICTCE